MTDLILHSTLSRTKEVFVPVDPAHVKMYVCGPTVYDFAHLGNARPVVVFDTLYRLLKRRYPRVTYVRNITDVDDKIMAKAKESNEPINLITERTTQAFHDDMAALNALPPDMEPLCTQHIPHMLDMIGSLIRKGHAYAAEGHVLFHVPSMPHYGELSRRTHDELIAGARVEVAPYKKDPADFVLWKPSTPDQVGWDIECSAMAKEHLGITFDIHGGGLDLIFPHHENEIAQSRCAHDGAPPARYWLHNGFLTIDNDKMSKSLGNFFTVRQLLAKTNGEALRVALLSAHYRQPLDFSEELLAQSKTTLDRWYGTLRRAGAKAATRHAEPITPSVEKALLDDLNTPLAFAAVSGLIKDILEPALLRQDSLATAQAVQQIQNAGYALGILQQDPELWFKGEAKADGLSDDAINAHIAARTAARQAKNFAESDRLRDTLAENGILLDDTATGTTWRRK